MDPLSVQQFFHCHECDASVLPSSFSPLTCPYCHGGFLEECIEESDLSSSSSSSASAAASSSSSSSPWDYMGALGQILDDISSFLSRADVVSGVNPFLLFQSQMQGLLSVQNDGFSSDYDHDLDPSYTMQDNDDDLGSGRNEFIAENVSNRYGSPPASSSSVQNLPTIVVSKQHLCMETTTHCAVCKDEFELEMGVKEMPCRHLYHKDCILPWLKQHNSCPVCRFELPTDDPRYDDARSSYHSSSSRINEEEREISSSFSGRDEVLFTPYTHDGSQIEENPSENQIDTNEVPYVYSNISRERASRWVSRSIHPPILRNRPIEDHSSSIYRPLVDIDRPIAIYRPNEESDSSRSFHMRNLDTNTSIPNIHNANSSVNVHGENELINPMVRPLVAMGDSIPTVETFVSGHGKNELIDPIHSPLMPTDDTISTMHTGESLVNPHGKNWSLGDPINRPCVVADNSSLTVHSAHNVSLNFSEVDRCETSGMKNSQKNEED